MSGPLQRCEALVLRHIDYAEADQIVSLLTVDFGLQKGFARAARKSRKRFGSSLQPFSQVIVHWRAGKGALWSLQEAELLSSRSGLRSDLHRLSLASYGVELVELLVEDASACPFVFELLCCFLDYLAEGGDLEVARLLFELRLIYLLGYIPHLLHCSECLKIFNNESIKFDAERGGSLCLACAGGSGIDVDLKTIGSLARTLNVGHRQFSGFKFGAKTRDEAGRMLAQVLSQVLPRKPKSLQFLPQL